MTARVPPRIFVTAASRVDEGKERLLGSPEERRSFRQLPLAAEEDVRPPGLGDRRLDVRGEEPAGERVRDGPGSRERLCEEEKIEKPAGALPVARTREREESFHVGIRRRGEARRVDENESADALRTGEGEEPRGRAPEGVADEIETVEAERDGERLHRGDTRRKRKPFRSRGGRASARARGVQRENGPPLAPQGEHRPGPVERVGAEAVEKNDGAIGREGPDHENAKRRSVRRPERLRVRPGPPERRLAEDAREADRVGEKRPGEERDAGDENEKERRRPRGGSRPRD